MKHVTFARAMPPQAIGDRRLVPDAAAAALEAEGWIHPNPPSWPAIQHNDPAPAPSPAPVAKRPPILLKRVAR
jgi:hypothetical protein